MLYHVVCHLDTEVEADSVDEALFLAMEEAEEQMDIEEMEDE